MPSATTTATTSPATFSCRYCLNRFPVALDGNGALTNGRCFSREGKALEAFDPSAHFFACSAHATQMTATCCVCGCRAYHATTTRLSSESRDRNACRDCLNSVAVKECGACSRPTLVSDLSSPYGPSVCPLCVNDAPRSASCDATALLDPLAVPFRDARTSLPVAFEIEAEKVEGYELLYQSLALLNYKDSIGYCSDGSLRNGVEVQTPPAREKDAKRLLSKVCRALSDNGCEAQPTCGLHLHIATGKVSNANVHRVLCAWYALEDLAFALVPPSRRANRFAKSWRAALGFPVTKLLALHPANIEAMLYSRSFSPEAVRVSAENRLKNRHKATRRAGWKKSIEQPKREKYGTDRYYAANIHSIYRQGSLEVRLHSGTIDPVKMLHWSRFCRAIVDLARVSSKQWKGVTAPLLSNFELKAATARNHPDASVRQSNANDLLALLGLPADTIAYQLARLKELNNL